GVGVTGGVLGLRLYRVGVGGVWWCVGFGGCWCVLGGVFLICKLIDEYGNFVKIYGVKGLVYIKVIECVKGMDGINSLVVKFLIVEIV
ncbi:hypothetical protein GH825_30195, partial [Bacillus thuringiensis]|nr:hypothetical protein [Bacillus thuringiensis]